MTLHTKYRPKTFDEVVGHKNIVNSIKLAIKNKTTQAWLLVGDAGRGKTTLGRLIANAVGADESDIIEADCAVNNSVDDIRNLISGVRYKSMSGTAKVFICDEIHLLGKGAFAALLKTLEEPPKHVYFVLCTSEASKVPKAIVQRCHDHVLKPVSAEDIEGLLTKVNTKEKLTTDEVISLIADKAEGSPRNALIMLGKCEGVKDRKEALSLIGAVSIEDNSAVADLCRELSKGSINWQTATKLLENLKDQNPESVRYVVLNWFQKIALGAKDSNRAQQSLAVLAAFSTPYTTTNGTWPLMLSLGQLIFN